MYKVYITYTYPFKCPFMHLNMHMQFITYNEICMKIKGIYIYYLNSYKRKIIIIDNSDDTRRVLSIIYVIKELIITKLLIYNNINLHILFFYYDLCYKYIYKQAFRTHLKPLM